MAKFSLSKRSNGEFQFNLVADNGEKILHSEGYTARPATRPTSMSSRQTAACVPNTPPTSPAPAD